MNDYPHYGDPRRKEIEQAILARFEAKAEHSYQWPRWAAAEEASHAVMALLLELAGEPRSEHTARPPHPNTMAGR